VATFVATVVLSLSMYLCYIDESGCTGALPSATSPIQPIFVIAGIIIEQSQLKSLTTSFLDLKRRFFPRKMPNSFLLDSILVEIKGSDLRRFAVSSSNKERRQAIGFLDHILALLEQYHARIIGRIWIKGIGAAFDGRSVYTYSIQNICIGFHHFLAQCASTGFVIADSRNKTKNASVAHSIFTQKFKLGGDTYDAILEMPTFGHSENHAGLQIADLLCSAYLFPTAAHAYCSGQVTSIHVRSEYSTLKKRYASRLQHLQYRYHDSGKWAGGIVISDQLRKKSGAALFK
jgi:hypothetical protein